MLTIALALAVVQSAPPDFQLPIANAKALNDRLIAVFPAGGRVDLRGAIVADDGSTIFGGSKEIAMISVDHLSYNTQEVFRRVWMPTNAPVSGNQSAWLRSSPGYDKSKQGFELIDSFTLLAAKDEDTVTLQYQHQPSSDTYFEEAISKISLKYGDPKDNRVIYTPKDAEFATNLVPDISSDGYLANICKRKDTSYDVVEQRVIMAPIAGRVNIKPGYGPLLFDSAKDLIICYTYTEEGTPFYGRQASEVGCNGKSGQRARTRRGQRAASRWPDSYHM
jgi:hypothetical protein